MAGKIQDVTDTTFQQEVLESPLPVVVDFWAAWCGPCRALAPTVEVIASEREGKVKVCKLDVDGNPAIAGQYGIRSIPTLLFFKGGKPVEQLVGNVAKGAIEQMLKKLES